MRRKAIFGGTFDPIHIGHLHVAYEALDKLKLDSVIFVPSGNPPHKNKQNITDAEARYNIVNIAIKDENRFMISDYELKKKGMSYTYETIEYFKNKEKDTQWFFISGIDCLMEIETWKNVDKILNNISFVAFSRIGYNINDVKKYKNYLEKKYCANIILLDIPIINISSTYIREKVKYGQEVKHLIPHKVYNYIKDKRLYI